MNTRSQFTFYESFRASTRRIKKAADRALAYDTICDYALYGIEPDIDKLPDSVAVFFLNAKPNLDASKRKAASGKKGGESKQTGSKPEANAKQIEANRKRGEPATEIEIENEKENEIENECYKGGVSESKKDADLSLFTSFWASYPVARGGGRERAFEEWKRLSPDADTARQIMQALELFKQSSSWKEYDGKYIPSAVKFLQEEQWRKPPVISCTGSGRQLDEDERRAIQQMMNSNIPEQEEFYGA